MLTPESGVLWPHTMLAIGHAIFHGTAISFELPEEVRGTLRLLKDSRDNLVFPIGHWLWDHLTPDLSRARVAEDDPPTA